MLLFEIVVALLLIGAVLSLWADRIGVPYPALLALAGAALALIPGTPRVMLDPELALALFVAPVLLDAAYDASPRDLRKNLLPVTSLAVGAVLVTIAAVAVVVRWLVPGVGWAVAVTLGAIVAPPDASAAIAVLRKLRPPHRVLVVLEGESLFNDATALLIYRTAMGAALTGIVSGWRVVPELLLTAVGSVLLGIVLARLFLMITTRVADIPISILLQFIATFGVWLLANRVGFSPVLTLISYAMLIARVAPGRVSARRRIASYAVWEVAVFVLNVLAFVLIGLQLRGVVTRAEGADWSLYVRCAAAVCGTIVLARFAWVTLHGLAVRWKLRGADARAPRPAFRVALIVSWCGMRGIVTLAAALALPDGASAAAFPHRDLIVFCGFTVVLFTLVVQGITLRPLMQWLKLEDDGSVERELTLARAETARAALHALRERGERPSVSLLRREYAARARSGEPSAPADPGGLAELQRDAVSAQRRALLDLRARDVIGDDAFHALEEELDLLELTADERIHPAMDEAEESVSRLPQAP
ncbi:MAG TPA: Na+/H+ antiporter [Steroidobacteraceae bacterium]|nr:Na+/H+ antiporter [Steroidobacteraceae bacterium]